MTSRPPSLSPWATLPQPVRDGTAMVVLLIGGVVPPFVLAERQIGWLVAPFAWLVALWAVLAVLVVLLRRRFDLVALSIGCCALLVGAFIEGSNLAATGSPAAVALYAMASTRPRRHGLLGLGAAVATTGLAVVLSPYASPLDSRLLAVIAILITAAALGETARARRAYIEEITARAERAEATRESEAQRRVAEDRLRIAQDLHDVVAHQIAVINLQAGVASASLRQHPEASESALKIIHDAARSVLREIGGLLAMLRNESRDSVGPDAEPVASLDRLDELVERFRDLGLVIDTIGQVSPGQLPPAVDLVAYRVIQEALTNAHKHGTGTVMLNVDAIPTALTITIENPVAPDPLATTSSGSRLGLQGIRERVEAVRGLTEISRVDGGRSFRLDIRIPLAAAGQSIETDDADGPG